MIECTLTETSGPSTSEWVRGKFDISISGTFTGKVLIERSLGNEPEAFNTCYETNAPIEEVGEVVGSWVRFNSSDDFTGSANCVLSA